MYIRRIEHRMPGYLKQFARVNPDADREEIVVTLPKSLVQQFRVYISDLNLSADEAVQHLVEQELHGTPKMSRRDQYREFWASLILEMGGTRTPLAQSWFSFASGHKGVTYTLSFGKDGRIRIELSIDTGDKMANHRIFEGLRTMRHDIEQRFPRSLSWEDNDHRRSCRIALYRPGRIDDDNIEELRAWFVRGLALFQDVFALLLQSVV